MAERIQNFMTSTKLTPRFFDRLGKAWLQNMIDLIDYIKHAHMTLKKRIEKGPK